MIDSFGCDAAQEPGQDSGDNCTWGHSSKEAIQVLWRDTQRADAVFTNERSKESFFFGLIKQKDIPVKRLCRVRHVYGMAAASVLYGWRLHYAGA